MKARSFTLRTSSEDRLDRAILKEAADVEGLAGLSRSHIQRLIERGLVLVNGKAISKAGTKIAVGDKIELELAIEASEIEAAKIPLSIIYEDESLMVIDKPTGLSMHPGAGERGATLLNGILGHLSVDPAKWPTKSRPGIVHRLDKDTSGLVVVAKDPVTHDKLSMQFSKRSVKRKYIALALSTPRGSRLIRQADSGKIDTLFGRDPKHRTKMAVLKSGGRRAVTHWQVLERMNYACLLELTLETGRTHQIRVHLNHISSPLIGDRVYGDFSLLPAKLNLAAEEFGGQALHAKSLGFVHPKNSKDMYFETPAPKNLEQLIDVFRKN